MSSASIVSALVRSTFHCSRPRNGPAGSALIIRFDTWFSVAIVLRYITLFSVFWIIREAISIDPVSCGARPGHGVHELHITEPAGLFLEVGRRMVGRIPRV